MPKHTSPRRRLQLNYGALALGTFFAGTTAFVLLNDVWNGAPFTVKHLLTIAALIAAIASGHMAWPRLMAGYVVTPALLAVTFVASTAYVVVSSGARNAEVTNAKVAASEHKVAAQEALKARIDELRKEKADAQWKADWNRAGQPRKRGVPTLDGRATVKAGCGSTCKGWEAKVDNIRAELDELSRRYYNTPATVKGSEYRHVARIFATVSEAGVDEIEGALILWAPFALVLITELATITFLQIALGHAPAPVKVAVASGPETRPETPPRGPNNRPGKRRRRKSGNPPGRPAHGDVIKFSDKFAERHGRPPTGAEIMREFPDLPKSTAYDHAARARTCNVIELREAV